MPKGTGIPLDEAIPLLADSLAYYDEDDVRRWFERYRRMCGRYPIVWPGIPEALRTFKEVPNEPFRAPFVELTQPMVLGVPVAGGREEEHAKDGTDWTDVFRDEIERIRRLPEAPSFSRRKIGPSNLSSKSISNFLRDVLGFRAKEQENGIHVPWLVQYEVAEALTKTLGLTPIAVGI